MNEEINKLKYGDVIWCEASKTEKYNFEGRHKLRPFTVIYKDKNHIYALAHTHDRNIGKLGYYVNERLRNVLIDEMIELDFSSFKNGFNGGYTSKELSNLSRCLAKKYKGEEVTGLISKHIIFKSGDLVSINNEKYLVRKVNEALFAEGIPYSGSSKDCNNKKVPLKAIVYLGQDKKNSIIELSGYEAFAHIWEGVSVNSWNSKDVEIVSDVIVDISKTIPIYYMKCTPDESAVCLLEEKLRKQVAK